MKTFNQHFKTTLIILGGPLFTYLFLNETMGINVALFTIWFLGILTLSRPNIFMHRSVQILFAATIITAFNCFWHTSTNALIALIINLLLLSGMAHKSKLQFVVSAFFNGLANFITFVKTWLRNNRNTTTESLSSNNILRVIKLTVAPLAAVVTFFFLFINGNLILSTTSDWFLDQFNLFFQNFSNYITLSSILLTLAGALITAWIIYSKTSNPIWRFDQKFHVKLARRKKLKKFKQLGLLNEYRSGLILLISINILLALVNGIDIYYVWFNQTPTNWSAADCSRYVHEGTFSLITSVLLSMGIMMYYFRGNQNFFKKINTLRTWAYIWIAQNTFLVLSLVIRNWSYVEQFDLAYKRIGVFIFLLATLVGLFTLVIKIRKKRTFYYLIQTNVWAWLILVFLMSFVNWDRLIVRYNLEHAENSIPDMKFILERSDKTLDIVAEYPQFLTAVPHFKLGYDNNKNQYISTEQLFINRQRTFIKRNQNQHWLSTNIIENQVSKNLDH